MSSILQPLNADWEVRLASVLPSYSTLSTSAIEISNSTENRDLNS